MRVLVMMSGGVDSSVAAALLRDEGHDVVGVTLKLWGGESDSGCCSVSDVDDARRVADHLGLDHHTFDFGDAFTEHVVGPYAADHAAGRTPNPCIECNRHIKFAAVDVRARQLGFDAVATGHHARISVRPDGTHRVARGIDAAKDQSYVLHPLDTERLSRTLLPIGGLTKAEVRARAAALGLRTANKPDSQDVCFITSTQGRGSFLGERIALTPARVVDLDGATVGEVDAVELVTVGQRKGLGLAGGGAPRYVVAIDRGAADSTTGSTGTTGAGAATADAAMPTVTVGREADLLVAAQPVTGFGWVGDPVDAEVLVQCSAHGGPRPAHVLVDGTGAGTIAWRDPQRRVAEGQSIVAYEGDEVCGGGTAAA